MRIDEIVSAYPVTLLAERGVVMDDIGAIRVVVVATADGSGGHAYEAGAHEFRSVDLDTGLVTDAKGGNWRITEDTLLGPNGEQLPRLPGHNAFWFSIVNHSAEWQLYE